MNISIGECWYGEWDETESTMVKARGFLLIDTATGEHVAIVPGADEGWSIYCEGAANARRIARAMESGS